MQLAASIIKVACNQANRNSFVNAIGGQAPVIPVAGSVQIPCAIFLDDPTVSTNLLTDLGNIVTANIVIRQGNSSTGTVLFQQVIAVGAINAGLTYVQWTAGTAAHFTFAMSPTDTNLAPGPIWIAIGVTTTNAGDVSLVYCSNGTVKDYGIFNAAAPTAPDYTSWSKAESDGRYATIAAGVDFRSDIESTAQVSAIAAPVEGQQVAFLNGDNTLLSYRYLASADAAANGTTVLASTVAGAYWFLVNTFDTDGESISASATAFPGDVYSQNGTKRLLTTDDVANITWTPTITSVGTGAAGSLETFATLTLPVSATLRQFIRTTGAGIESWVLQAGTDATSSDGSGNPAVQRPADFNASTNAKVWVRKG